MPLILGVDDPVREPDLPHIATFYSFKGGVGRTLALANTALLLAKHGRDVLVIDADLEAPGLSYVSPFCGGPEDRPGFLDMLEALLCHIPTEDGGEWVAPRPGQTNGPIKVDDFAATVALPSGLGGDRQGRLAYISAGSDTDDYAARVDALSIGRLYASGVGQRLFRHFKAVLKCEAYDYILIDSRTGWSDIGGMCTRDLADTVVVVCGLNKQNVQGTRRVLDAIDKGRSGDPSDNVILVASPVPREEEMKKQQRLREMAEDLGRKPDVLLPYHSLLALEETPFVGTYDDSDLVGKYVELMHLVLDRASDGLLGLIKMANDHLNAENRDAAKEKFIRAGWTDKARTLSGLNQLRSVIPIKPGRFPDDRRLVHDLMMSLKPDDTEESLEFGMYLLQVARETKQIQLVREAKDILAHLAERKSDPISTKALYHWGIALSEQAGLEADTTKARRLLDEAEEKFSKASRAMPDSYKVAHNWGVVLGQKAEIEGDASEARRLSNLAVEKLAEAVGLKPDNYSAFNNWGKVLGYQAKREGNAIEAKRLRSEAAEKFAEAIRLKPDFYEAFFNWGVALHEAANHEGDIEASECLYEEAINRYAISLQLKPDFPDAHFNLAYLKALKGDIQGCVDSLRSWMKTDPSPNRERLDAEPDFDNVREAPEFVAFRNGLPAG